MKNLLTKKKDEVRRIRYQAYLNHQANQFRISPLPLSIKEGVWVRLLRDTSSAARCVIWECIGASTQGVSLQPSGS